jgi:predicted metalloprotease
VVLLLGGNPSAVLNQLGGSAPASSTFNPRDEEELRQFSAVVLKDTEDVWDQVFREQGRRYEKPTLVLFTDRVKSACGTASSEVGPFYCGEDRKLYIDLSFYRELKTKFGAEGDFAQAYVVAHEVGHHVQNLLGTLDKVHAQQGRLSKKQYNELSVRLELQADYYAGLFARRAENMKTILEKEDIESAVTAAAAIGDDTLQKEAQGYAIPDSFTHGTSDQRVRWFLKGWESGQLRDGNTFNVRRL